MVWPNLIAPPKYDNPAEGWEDPRLPDIREIWKLAREVGYAIGVHGSLKRDFDLIAVPWTEEAISTFSFIQHMATGLNARVLNGPTTKPQGRIAVILQPIEGYFKHIDISIMPRI